MPDVLVIRLCTPVGYDLHARWSLVDATGGRLSVVMSGRLGDATSLAQGRRVIVLLPGPEVHLAEPTLPVKRGAQLEQVTRYALEENLAGDVDALHLAIGKRRADGRTPVAAIDNVRMQFWLGQLQAASIDADAVYSEADAVPTTAGGATIVIDDGLVHLKRDDRCSVTIDVEPLEEALELALPAGAETPGDVCIYLHQEELPRYQATFDALKERIATLQIKLLPEGALPLFALQVLRAPGINLLTGPYARKRSWNKAFAPWRVAAALLGAALTLQLLTSGVQWWQLARAERQLDNEIGDLVRQTIPGTAVDAADARRQFEARLQTVGAGSVDRGLLPGLSALSSALEQVPDTHIDALAFRTDTFDLRVTAPNVDALARMQQLVSDQGLHAEIQSATPHDNKVEGRLQLKAPGA